MVKNKNDVDGYQPILYKKRWIMLALFCSVSMLNAFQWLHLNIIRDNLLQYWKGSLPAIAHEADLAIAWLAMIYMLVYIPFLIPANWLLERHGLRTALLLAAVLNCIGAWLKCLAVELSQPIDDTSVSAAAAFGVLFLGQTVCATCQVFILSIPAHLAGVWFGERELAFATAMGVFGNQVGIAFGFAFPPLIVVTPAIELSSDDAFNLLRHGFRILCYSFAAIILLDLVLIAIFFKSEPEHAPNRAQQLKKFTTQTVKNETSQDAIDRRPMESVRDEPNEKETDERENVEKMSFSDSLKALFCNKSYNILILCYGVNTGVYYANGTLLSVILGEYYPNYSTTIGFIGFTMIIAGLVGAMAAGLILEKSQKYKLTVVTYYIMSTVAFSIYVGTIYTNAVISIFLSIFALGFFQSGYLPLGFQFAAEITYPVNEGLSSGILNISAQVFGILMTLTLTILHGKFGGIVANLFMVVSIIICLPANFFMKENLRRRKAQQMVNTHDSEVKLLIGKSKMFDQEIAVDSDVKPEER